MTSTNQRLPHQLPEIAVIRGVKYRLPQWMEPGQSFFVPCLDARSMGSVMATRYSGLGWKTAWAERIEQGMLGIRIWREV